jgi:prepilin-type N-terminal cleavage/methylation domain-containing protein
MTVNDEQGFTLAEMLVSLVIFSLAMAIIWQGAGLVSRLNTRVHVQQTTDLQVLALTRDLSAKLLPLQPITDSQLTGGASRITFQCEPKTVSQNCTYNLPLGHFIYIAEGARYAAWPQAKAEGVSEPLRLAALGVENDQGKSLAIIKFPVEHPADCQFDMISRTCRSEAAISEAIP